MRAAIVAALLAGPTVLAFFSGAYFDRPRLWAGIAASVAVAAAAIATRRPWPRTTAAWLAVGGLTGLTAWTAASIAWAPMRDVAQDDAQRLVLYVAALMAGIAVFRSRSAARAAEPVLALGILVVILEGMSERLLPGLFELTRSQAVPGRLYQPLTYWNAMGLLAAIGVVLSVRLAGDATRRRWMRALAAGSVPTLAVAGYLTLSRGAIGAVLVGLTLVAVLAPRPAQLRALAASVVIAAPCVVIAALLPGVRALEGSAADRETEGLAMLAVLVLAGLVAGAVVALDARRLHKAERAAAPSRHARWATRAAAVAVGAGVVAVFAVLAAQDNDSTVGDRAETSRLATAGSIRGDFWRVARRAFADEPLHGVGSGGFGTEWLRERTVVYAARDAHSLAFETPAELGLVGLALLAAFLAGIGWCAVRAHRRDPVLTTGPIAVTALWIVHAGQDWDWEMPAVTLIFLVFAAVLVARGDERAPRAPDAGTVMPRAAGERPAEAGVAL
jgi:hypothetical protein